jgi:hypothetical protein
MTTVEKYGRDLLETVNELVEGTDASFEEKLVEHAFSLLTEDSRYEDPTPCFFKRDDFDNEELIYKLNGFDPQSDEGEERVSLDLFVAIGIPDDPCRVVLPAEANAAFRAVRRFIEDARNGSLRQLVEDDPEVRDLASDIAEAKNLSEINIVLITNGRVLDVDRSPLSVGKIAINRRVLDLDGMRRGNETTSIEVEFGTRTSSGFPCVEMPAENKTYRSFLAIVPGSFLCDLYLRHGHKLLEANVRSYLRANGAVNKGIIKTIRDQPHMFFAFNNGITATAEDLKVEKSASGTMLVRCKNLQIVNGGQTTASLAQARRKKDSLDSVFVAMKISEVVDPERVTEVVQSISRYANSQNKVSFSDLGANDPFHVQLQNLAENEVAARPAEAPAGELLAERKPTYWYYERMRGQYQNDLARLKTKKQKDEYKVLRPKSQVFSKIDIGRWEMTWNEQPYAVSRGGEKNYAIFSDWRRKNLPTEPTVTWFRHLIAKGLVVEACDRLVRESKIPGYKANIVAYAVALLVCRHREEISLDRIWERQEVDASILDWLRQAIPPVRDHILEPAAIGGNVGEVSKKPDCWEKLLERPLDLPWLTA